MDGINVAVWAAHGKLAQVAPGKLEIDGLSNRRQLARVSLKLWTSS